MATVSIENVERAIYESSLYEFVKAAWRVLEPNNPFIDGEHIRVLCSTLERVTRRQLKNPGVIFNIPPGMSKTMIVAVCWPAWEWTQAPWLRYNVFSYAERLSKDSSRFRRALIMSEWYSHLWPHVRIAEDNNQVMEFSSTSAPGAMIASSVGGVATGRGGERLIIDDSMNPKIAASDARTEETQRWLRETLPSRIRNQGTGATVIIEQRLGLSDATSLGIELGFEHVCLPMEFEPDHPYRSPLDWRTRPGELLCEGRVNVEQLARIKRAMGSFAYETQYQQRPGLRGGGLWKVAWFKQWRALPTTLTNYTQSWDFAAKDTKDGSYNVGQVWAENGADKYLLDQVRFRGGMNDALTMVRALSNKWPQCRAKLIEDKANGSPILNMLEQEIGGLIATNPGVRGKAERAQAVAPFIEAGNIWIPAEAGWLSDFLSEVEAFPNGAHDDQVDAASQALERLCVPVSSGGYEMMQDAMASLYD